MPIAAVSFRSALVRLLSASLCLLISSVCLAAGEEPPAGINAHYAWCGEAKTVAAKLKRYEQFWKDRRPAQDDEYDDQPHVTYVRRCAYRLASLYAETGQKAKCLEMLRWLEKRDDTFPENAQ